MLVDRWYLVSGLTELCTSLGLNWLLKRERGNSKRRQRGETVEDSPLPGVTSASDIPPPPSPASSVHLPKREREIKRKKGRKERKKEKKLRLRQVGRERKGREGEEGKEGRERVSTQDSCKQVERQQEA